MLNLLEIVAAVSAKDAMKTTGNRCTLALFAKKSRATTQPCVIAAMNAGGSAHTTFESTGGSKS